MAARDRETIGDESLENWKELGSGGFGCVYKASHKDWGFDVAIKLLVGSDTLSTALGREAGHMDAVAHQFVPRVYGMYQGIPPVPDLGYIKRQGIVMELMQRGSLLSLQKALSGPPPWALAFRLANQLAVAMNFLHSKKPAVVHSDLKPDNVLLDAHLDAKLADFGLSMVSTSVLNTSNKGDEGGSLFYTAPEAFEQHYRPVRSYDIYSYGILLWTILTGKEPYLAGVNRDVLIFRIMQGDRPDLHTIDQSKADGLEELVDLMKRCWDKDPTKRPTFRECTEVTGRVFSKHEKGINAAVYETMTNLDSVNRQEGVRPPGCTEVTGRVFSKHQKGIKAAVNETLTKLDSVNRQEECVRPPGHAATKATEDRPPTKPVPQADTPGPMQTCIESPVNDSLPSVPPGSTNRKDYLKHFSHLTLNTNTAHSRLFLSKDNMVAKWMSTGPPPPDHPDRFDGWTQVLCTEGLTGPCYWEVERNGAVLIAVTYGGISRKGWGHDCGLGCNDKSWSLVCDDNSYIVRHNNKQTVLPVRPSGSMRVAVYLDCPLGTLSFYEVCSDSLTHLYTFTFHNTFSEPLYAGFWLPWSSSSVRLCEQR